MINLGCASSGVSDAWGGLEQLNLTDGGDLVEGAVLID